MSAKKYFLKEPFIFDFNKLAKQSVALVAVVAFITALFLFSGVFLDATAESERADVLVATPAEELATTDAALTTDAQTAAEITSPLTTEAEQTEDASSTEAEQAESASSAEAEQTEEETYLSDVREAALDLLGDFIGISPFINVTVASASDLATAIQGFVGVGTLYISVTGPNPMVLNPADITVASGRSIHISSLGATPMVIQRAETDTRRHFLVDGTLTLENIILCGTTTGTFSMTQNVVRVGGGVDVRSGGTLNLNANSLIRNSTADFGGGVRVRAGANLTINGGEVSNNAATVHGGGIYLNGANANMTMNRGRVADNNVEGRVAIAAEPLPGGANGAIANAILSGAMHRTWYSSGINDLTGPLPAHFDFPPNVNLGGGGIAARNGAWVTLDSVGGSTEIYGNFAERGGGIYITGNNSRLDIVGDNVSVSYNSSHHSHMRDFSATRVSSLDNWPVAGVTDAGRGQITPISPNQFNWDHILVSGSGGGIHVFGTGATFNMSAGSISRNVAITRIIGVTVSGGGGVSVHNGASFNMTGGIIGGDDIDDANMVSNRPGCDPTFTGSPPNHIVTGGCTPQCHPNHPNRPAAQRVDGWANLHPCVNGHRQGQNRVGADRVGFAVAPTAVDGSIGSVGAGVMVTSATFTATNATITNNRVRMIPGTVSSGGGVAVVSPSVGSMQATIGRFTMNSGTEITLNNGGYRGGGVSVIGGSEVVMNGNALIADNVLTASGRGGGVAMAGGTFTMNDNTRIVDHTRNNWVAGRPGFGGSPPNATGTFAHGGGVSMDQTGGTFIMNDNALIANNRVHGSGGGVTIRANTGSGSFASPLLTSPVFTMNNDAHIRGNNALANGGGVEIVGNGPIFNMNNNAAIGARATGTIDDAHRNIASNHGGGIFSIGNGVTINMSMNPLAAGQTAIRGNRTTQNGGGVLIGGTVHATVTPPGPQGALLQPGIEVGRSYPTFNIGQGALIADNHARLSAAGISVNDPSLGMLLLGGGGGIYVGGISTALTPAGITEEQRAGRAGVNLLGGTIARNQVGLTTPVAAQSNSNGAGVFVRSFANGANNSIEGLNNHYGFRAVSGTISNNSTVTGGTVPLTSGNGGGIFTMRYLHRSPLANNPLFETPFVTQAQADSYAFRNYSNLNISANTVFSGNNAARDSYPPLGEQLSNIQWNPASGSSVSRAVSTHPNNRVYLLNNFDINYMQPTHHDFWFVKEDIEGNPLSGVTFELRNPQNNFVNSPLANGRSISDVNGLVGFPESLTNFGATQNYRLTELEATSPSVSIPAGHWTFHLLNRLRYVEEINNSNLADPEFDFSSGNANSASLFLNRYVWRVYNVVIQPASFSFFKTDMSIYGASPNLTPPRLTGASFALYRFNPQLSGGAQFADSVTPQGVAAGYWEPINTAINHNPASNNVHSFSFTGAGQNNYAWASTPGPTIFHLVETQAPNNYELPDGQWRFVLAVDTSTGAAITPGHTYIRPVLAPTSNAPTFEQPRAGQVPPDRTWYVGNEPLFIPTGLTLESATLPLAASVSAGVILLSTVGVLKYRTRRIEEFL